MKSSTSSKPSISEEVFSQFIKDTIGCDVYNAPNSSWRYDTTDFLGSLREQYETYIYKKTVKGNPKCKKIVANVVKGESVNFCMDVDMTKQEVLELVHQYRKLFYPDYTIAECKKEYSKGKKQFGIDLLDINPCLSIIFPNSMQSTCSLTFYTSFCNKAYIEKQLANKKVLTLLK